ncbi:MAG: segregation/condensation protein A [Planctomycetes bacterium]|nr:segregation/condensation protein A [Planctomycetota bacterium]
MADEMADEVDAGGNAIPAQTAVEIDLRHQVRLETFAGPLDLLLYLVRRAEVDITDIPIADIADQFVAAVASWTGGHGIDEHLDLEAAGDFILMAATLLEMKSRMIAPPPENAEADEAQEDEETIDPRSGLIRQLLAYRRCKEATQILNGLDGEQSERSPRQLRESIPEDPDEADGISLSNCDPGMLYSLWESIQIRINGLGPRTVINDDQPLEVRINALIDTLRMTGEARLGWLFAAESSRLGRVGILMATLECVRQRFFESIQHEQYGEVYLTYRSPDLITAVPPIDPVEEDVPKRRRKPQLVTFHAASSDAATPEDDAAAGLDEGLETDEQRFLRELEEACAVDSVLSRVADLEQSFGTFLEGRKAGIAVPDHEIVPTP